MMNKSSSVLKKAHSVEDSGKAKSKHKNGHVTEVESPGKVKDLRLKELPLVHQTNKRIESLVPEPSVSNLNASEQWIVNGGSSGLKSAILQFRCSALSDPPVDPPAEEYHMTYKTIQAETKLLSAILNAHGMREVVRLKKN